MTEGFSRTPDRGPLLGALLRFAHQSILRRVMDELAAAGSDDLQPAHFAPLLPLWDSPEGLRATELADRARITKQSMGELVEQLSTRGYVERVPDPEDGRARLIRMTARGRKACRLARKAVREVEADWSRRVGAARIEEMRKTLEMLRESATR